MADRVHTTRTWSSDRFPEAVASAVQAPGRAVLVTSADADAVGDGEHWTPTELLAAALSGCLFHAALDVAGRSKVELRGWRDQVVLTLDRTNGPARRVVAATVEVCVTVPAGTRRAGRSVGGGASDRRRPGPLTPSSQRTHTESHHAHPLHHR
jgi:organic hydroperoxide reductase OsmC/OhrA